jgi:hypothetical protein
MSYERVILSGLWIALPNSAEECETTCHVSVR